MDNDVYGHVNNVVYYAFFDTVINRYLIAEGGLDIARGAVIGLCVESRCRYRKPIAFPEDVDAGLRVAKLGRSSVTYEMGIFARGEDDAAAEGSFVHVFVERGAEVDGDPGGGAEGAREDRGRLARETPTRPPPESGGGEPSAIFCEMSGERLRDRAALSPPPIRGEAGWGASRSCLLARSRSP